MRCTRAGKNNLKNKRGKEARKRKNKLKIKLNKVSRGATDFTSIAPHLNWIPDHASEIELRNVNFSVVS
jgi:hypothetical protein